MASSFVLSCTALAVIASLAPALQLSAKSRGALPEVSTLFGGTSDTLKSINTQTIMLETRVAQKQQENQAQLAKLKSSYEKKLQAQRDENVAASTAIAKDLATISTMERTNDQLRADFDRLSKENAAMRGTISSMGGKLGTALAFVNNTLNVSNAASEDAEVASLAQLTKVEREKRDVEERKRTGNDPARGLSSSDSVEQAIETIVRAGQLQDTLAVPTVGLSLLEVSSQHSKTSPSDADALIAILSKSLEAMDAEEKDNEQKLKDIFVTRFQDGVKQQLSLATTQKAATERIQTLTELQGKLTSGKAKLEDTHKQLMQRLAGLRLFVGRLSSNFTQ